MRLQQRSLLLVLALLLAAAICCLLQSTIAAVAAEDLAHGQVDGTVRVALEAQPGGSTVFAALQQDDDGTNPATATPSTKASSSDDLEQPSAVQGSGAVATPNALVAPLVAAATERPSRVYAPVPDHLLDDPLQHLFTFDGGAADDVDLDTSSSSSALLADASPAHSLSRAHVTAFAPLVLRVARRVVSAGQWTPAKPKKTQQADRSRPYSASSGDDDDASPPPTPPSIAPSVTTNTLNLLVRATYVRSGEGGEGVVQRSMHLSVLPGPSFVRGSLAALSDKFGPDAIGFEPQIFSMVDTRRTSAEADAADAAADASGTRSPAQEESLASFSADDADEESAEHRHARLPGWGPLQNIKTMSGQHNENWVVYSSGVRDDAKDKDGDGGHVQRNVALYTLLVHGWSDSSLARAQTDAHALAESEASRMGLDPPPALSLNTLGVRIRVTPDFVVRPFVRNVATISRQRRAATLNMHGMTQQEVEKMYDPTVVVAPTTATEAGKQVVGETPADKKPAAASAVTSSVEYAQIVDFVMYQQRRFIFIGVAYDDGFIRIFSRNGTLRNEIHTLNSTILHVAMSNWGSASSGSLGSQGGGGARDSSSGLNGVNNGNQMMAYVSPSGIGLVKMARIHHAVEQYCAWDPHAITTPGVAHGRDVAALAFDSSAHSTLYVASHSSREILVLSTRLGWDSLNPQNNFDAQGLRKPCPPTTGCLCHASGVVAMQFAVPPSTSAASGAFARPQYTLLSLRGFLLVASARTGALAVFNASTVGDIQRGETGLEFMLERQLTSAPVTTTARQRAPPPQRSVHLAQLTGDRIDLIIGGHVANCEIDACTASELATATATATTPLPPPPSFAHPLHVLQHFLPSPDSGLSGGSGLWGSWSVGSLGTSRAPLFVMGVIGMLVYQYFKRNRRGITRQRTGEGDEDDEEDMMRDAELESRGIVRKRKGGGRATAAMMDGGGLDGLDEAALRRMVEQANASGADPDTQAFMKDFLAWQKRQNGGGGGGGRGGLGGGLGLGGGGGRTGAASLGISGPGGLQRPPYMDELSGERARFQQHYPVDSTRPPPRSGVGAASAASAAAERRRMNARTAAAAAVAAGSVAAYGLGVGGFDPVAPAAAPSAPSAASIEEIVGDHDDDDEGDAQDDGVEHFDYDDPDVGAATAAVDDLDLARENADDGDDDDGMDIDPSRGAVPPDYDQAEFEHEPPYGDDGDEGDGEYEFRQQAGVAGPIEEEEQEYGEEGDDEQQDGAQDGSYDEYVDDSYDGSSRFDVEREDPHAALDDMAAAIAAAAAAARGSPRSSAARPLPPRPSTTLSASALIDQVNNEEDDPPLEVDSAAVYSSSSSDTSARPMTFPTDGPPFIDEDETIDSTVFHGQVEPMYDEDVPAFVREDDGNDDQGDDGDVEAEYEEQHQQYEEADEQSEAPEEAQEGDQPQEE